MDVGDSLIDTLISARGIRVADRIKSIELLRQLPAQQGIPQLVTALRDPSVKVRVSSIEALGELCRKAPRQLVLKLRDSDELVRVAAVEALENIGDPRAVPNLRQCVKDPSPLVRSFASSALGTFGVKKDESNLRKSLAGERSGLARAGMCAGLYLLGDRNSVESLLSLTNSRLYRVRCAAANTLASLPLSRAESAKVVDYLTDRLKTETTVAARSSLVAAIRELKS
jgi:HEAT repeat protein